MLLEQKKLLLLLLFVSSFTYSCGNTKRNGNVVIARKYTPPSTGSSYTITVPTGWHEVRNSEEVKKHLFWEFPAYNSSFARNQTVRAWDGPEEEVTFMTIIEMARHSSQDLNGFYDDVIRHTKEMGWNIQETGMTKIDGSLCKWWTQSYVKGNAKQQCYFFGHDDRIYVLAFATYDLHQDNKQMFDKIAHTFTFAHDRNDEGLF